MVDGDNAEEGSTEYTLWTGPYATATYMDSTCPNDNNTWPNVYPSCGTNGMHLWNNDARWAWDRGNTAHNTAFEVYIR